MNVDLYTTVLGGKAEVNTFTGPIRVSIPTGSQKGKTLWLKGKGMLTYDKKNKYGNTLVKLLNSAPANRFIAKIQLELLEQPKGRPAIQLE